MLTHGRAVPRAVITHAHGPREGRQHRVSLYGGHCTAWPALLNTIAETGASRVLATHGHAESLSRFLKAQGVEGGVRE